MPDAQLAGDFINDGSRDETHAFLDQFALLPNVQMLNHRVNRSCGSALKTGICHVKTAYLVTIDADGHHYLSDAEKVYRFMLEKDADNAGFKLYRTERAKKNTSSFTQTQWPLAMSSPWYF